MSQRHIQQVSDLAIKLSYSPAIKERWEDGYFEDRNLNNPERVAQFAIDAHFLKSFISKGVLCDIGCSTGEFVRHLDWQGKCYGMEINDRARTIASEVIDFGKNIFTEVEFFDVVIFRGSIQHVDTPFHMIKMAYQSLKKGGYIVFLATPNSNSILFRLKQELPFLDPKLNFYIPGVKDLSNALSNFGFEIQKVDFPYWNTPYRKVVRDHLLFIMNICSKKFYKHPFWGSSINLCAKKSG
jgi:SAM-dependent methyltransferase